MIYILTSCIVDYRQDAVHVQFGAKKKAFIKKKEKKKKKRADGIDFDKTNLYSH